MEIMRREEGSSPLKKAQSGGCGPSSGLDKQKESLLDLQENSSAMG